MRIIQISIFIVFWTAFIIAPLNSFACTIFTIQKGESVMFGGNEDQEAKSSFLVVDKKGRFDVVYFATPWKQGSLVMTTGINDKGLCYDVNWIPEENLNQHPERKPQRKRPIVKLMREAATVEDVLSKIFTYNWGSPMSYQIHFADIKGDAAVIHPGPNGELTYTRKKQGDGYLISTNFNLAYLDKGGWSCRRYDLAEIMLSKIDDQNDVSVDSLASVLFSTHQNTYSVKTLYSMIYDLQNLRIYLYYNRQFKNPHILDVKKELDNVLIFRRKVSLEKLISIRD